MMNETEITNKTEVGLLKEARLQLLRLHKLLVDNERENYEKINGQISSGEFLNLLINARSFEWLRKFSTLIVEIDEMLDLNDGFTDEMIEKHLFQMRELLELKASDNEFKDRFKGYLQSNPEVADKHAELKKLLVK